MTIGYLLPLAPVWPVLALAAAVFCYMRHSRLVERERRVPLALYVVALIGAGGLAAFFGIIKGVSWACADPASGNLCGLVGVLVTGPIAGSLAVVAVGLALSFVRPTETPVAPPSRQA